MPADTSSKNRGETTTVGGVALRGRGGGECCANVMALLVVICLGMGLDQLQARAAPKHSIGV